MQGGTGAGLQGAGSIQDASAAAQLFSIGCFCYNVNAAVGKHPLKAFPQELVVICYDDAGFVLLVH